MNLFRSEEHARKRSGFEPGTEEGIVGLSASTKAFSGDFFGKRSGPDYFSHPRSIDAARSFRGVGEDAAVLVAVGKVILAFATRLRGRIKNGSAFYDRRIGYSPVVEPDEFL